MASDSGYAAGQLKNYLSGNPNGSNEAVRWLPSGEVQKLARYDDFGGAYATGINESGTVVGQAQKFIGSQNKGTRATRWDAGSVQATELEILSYTSNGAAYTYVNAVNDVGVCVGHQWIYENDVWIDTQPVVWDVDGHAIKLNDLGVMADDGHGTWDLGSATGISTDGWIGLGGKYDPDGNGPLEGYGRFGVAQIGLGGDWLNTTNTDNVWGRGRNWSTGTPAIQLDAKFNSNANYHVAFDDDESARNVIVSAGHVMFDLAADQEVVVDQTLTISNASQLRVADGLLKTASLEIGSGSSLDVGDAKLVVDYLNASPFTSIKNWIVNHSITSDLESGQAIGLAEASVLFGANGGEWLGDAVDGSSILVVKTLAGDANLDLHVNFADLLRIAQHYGQSNQNWSDGDTNLDGIVNFNDLLFVAQNYNDSLDALTASNFSDEFAYDWSIALSQVPEPSSMLIGAGMAIVALRRKRD